jgi:hypothetical protein
VTRVSQKDSKWVAAGGFNCYQRMNSSISSKRQVIARIKIEYLPSKNWLAATGIKGQLLTVVTSRSVPYRNRSLSAINKHLTILVIDLPPIILGLLTEHPGHYELLRLIMVALSAAVGWAILIVVSGV